METQWQEPTLAEATGMTAELGAVIARVAEAELEAGRAGIARAILEGLVVTNPRDALAWALLSRAHRAGGQGLAARFCAEVAVTVGPDGAAPRLALAEALLLEDGEGAQARALLEGLAGDPSPEGERARALLAAGVALLG